MLVPFGGGHPYDLVVDLEDGSVLRVQCKTGRPVEGCIHFNSRTTDHGRGRLPYDGLADLFGVYFRQNGSVYLVPVREATGYVTSLRLVPTRNNQRRRVRHAADYEIDQWPRDRLRELVAGPQLTVAA
jgi:PD-(D/E)XK endonuclease